jgi:hypothetical protein
LRHVDGAVVTRARQLPAASRAVRRCAARFRGVDLPTGEAVERTGVDGRSLTFATGPLVFSCDGAAAALEGDPRDCGGAAGKLAGGVLADGRLQLSNCLAASRDPVAFVWVEPRPGARWLAVRRDGWAEVYEARRGLPVRVATTDGVALSAASLTLRLAEYDADGTELGERELSFGVAG